MDLEEALELLRDNARVLACDAGRLVLMRPMRTGMSRRARWLMAGGALVLLPFASMVSLADELPGVSRLATASIGLVAAACFAGWFLVDERIIALAGGDGIVIERRNFLLGRRSKRLLLPFSEITGYDVERTIVADLEDPTVHYTLRLHAGSRRLPLWTTWSRDVGEAAGSYVLHLAGSGAGGDATPERTRAPQAAPAI